MPALQRRRAPTGASSNPDACAIMNMGYLPATPRNRGYPRG